MLDEATASIDLVTEQKVQELLATEFSECTMIVIAHRLQTVLDSDSILVLDNGRVIEEGSPTILLQTDSHLKALVESMEQ